LWTNERSVCKRKNGKRKTAFSVKPATVFIVIVTFLWREIVFRGLHDTVVETSEECSKKFKKQELFKDFKLKAYDQTKTKKKKKDIFELN
jgi:predicted heme/steroid binding protein